MVVLSPNLPERRHPQVDLTVGWSRLQQHVHHFILKTWFHGKRFDIEMTFSCGIINKSNKRTQNV